MMLHAVTVAKKVCMVSNKVNIFECIRNKSLLNFFQRFPYFFYIFF